MEVLDKEELRELFAHWWINDIEIIDSNTSRYEFTCLGVGDEWFYKEVKLNFLDRLLGVDIIMKTNLEIRKLDKNIDYYREEFLRKLDKK